jgi:hypothetical protein
LSNILVSPCENLLQFLRQVLIHWHCRSIENELQDAVRQKQLQSLVFDPQGMKPIVLD